MRHCLENKQTLLDRVLQSFVIQKDTQTLARTLKLLTYLVKLNPKFLTKDQARQISGCIYNSAQAIREETTNFLIVVSKMFDEENKLLQIQQLPKKNDDGSEVDFEINFKSEANKSKSQILRLFKLQDKYIMTKKDLINHIKLLNPNYEESVEDLTESHG